MRKDRIAETAERLVESGAFSGLEWCIEKGGKSWSRGQAGQLDATRAIPMPEKPIYRIYSMTKPIVSVAALMLMERMKLRLFDPVAAFLPEFAKLDILEADGSTRRARNMMIVEHLLTHRAGLSYGFLAQCPVGLKYRDANLHPASVTLEGFVRQIAQMPLAFEPGTQWRYSVATDVLARLLEMASGKDIATLLKDLIFDPLGMAETGYSVAETERDRVMAIFGNPDLDAVMDYVPGPQTLRPADVSREYPTDDPAFSRGGHGLFSTLDDYMIFARFLRSGRNAAGDRLLSRKTVEMLHQNRIPQAQMPLAIGPIVLPGYGYGLTGRVLAEPGAALGLTSAGEGGWSGAAGTYYWLDPVEDVTGVVMTQYLGSLIPAGDDIRVAAYQALDA